MRQKNYATPSFEEYLRRGNFAHLIFLLQFILQDKRTCHQFA